MPSAKDDPFDLMTVDEVAAALHITRQQLFNLRSRGDAPAGFRLGRTVVFRRTEVVRWLAEQEDKDPLNGRAQRQAARRRR